MMEEEKMNVTTKENGLLKDLRGQEQLCIEKYEKYAAEACASELQTLFHELADVERGHLRVVNEMMNGKVEAVGGQGSSSGSCACDYKATYSDESCRKKDAFLCSDMLSTEKHVSALYDTSIFEFSDAQARNVLNNIQAQEQQHGLRIYDFMSANGMYQ